MSPFVKIAAVSTLCLSGCAATGPSSPKSGGGSVADTCNAAAYQNLIGQDAVVDLSLPEPKRTYRMGDPVTQDYNPARLNVILDDTDTIIAINCG